MCSAAPPPISWLAATKPAAPSVKGTLPLASAARAAAVATYMLPAMAATLRWAAVLAAGIWPPWEINNTHNYNIPLQPEYHPLFLLCVFHQEKSDPIIYLPHPPLFYHFIRHISSHLAPILYPWHLISPFMYPISSTSRGTSFISSQLWFHPIKSGSHLSVILNLMRLVNPFFDICVCSQVQWLGLCVGVCVWLLVLGDIFSTVSASNMLLSTSISCFVSFLWLLLTNVYRTEHS